MKPLELDYFYGNDAEQFTFYRIPKVLFTDQRYKSVSVEAKVLYGLLLDRMSLSIRNDWLDADGRVYIYFTLEEAIEFLGFGKDKLVKLYQELDRDRGIGLIERKKQGQGKPTKIYVKNFTIPGDAPLTSEKPKSEPSAALQTSEMAKSRLRSGRSADCGISASNYTDKKDTEWSDTESIYPPPPPQVQHTGKGRRRLRMDEIEQYRTLVKENIDYERLLEEHPYDHDLIDGYVELIVEICCSRREYIRVNQEDMPRDLVKSRLLKLDKEHIAYVMDCLSKNTTLVGNIKAYTLSALYNAPITISQHYTSLVSHDMAQDAMASY